MESIWCVRRASSPRRLPVLFTMLLSVSVLCTLYILTLSCCAGVGEVGQSRLSKVILLRDGDEDEGRYQQVLEQLSDSPTHIRRKPLDDTLVDRDDQTRTHGRRRHKTTYTEHDTEASSSSSVVLRYDDDDDDPAYSEYDPKRSHRARPHQKATRRLPQAIIIGVKKGGTRALLEFLRMHPNVRAPGPEPHFFDRNYDKGLEWYRRQMPPTYDDQLTIEKTPGYFVTKGVPGRIFNMSKNVRFIVVVRDPVTRAISDYTQALVKRSNISSFEGMAFEDNTTGLVDTSWGAIRIGVYAKHLERWLQYFPLSQIHFVSGEKLISNPAGELARVQDFLGLPRTISRENFVFSSAKGFPCLLRPDGKSKKPHCLGKTKGREHPKIEPQVLQRLRDFFRPFNQKFYQMVGQDFGWS